MFWAQENTFTFRTAVLKSLRHFNVLLFFHGSVSDSLLDNTDKFRIKC